MAEASHEQIPNSRNQTINFLLDGLYRALAFGAEQQLDAQRVEEIAMIDPLTELRNRRALERDYEGLVTSSHDNEPVALLIADVDRFKSINDSYGHKTGDMVLKGVAAAMSESVRRRDVVARWGGEEFAILLPRASEEVAFEKAEEMRRHVAKKGLMKGIDKTRRVTVSIGVAMVDLSKPLEFNVATADLALYAAKEQGRDQVVLASQIPKMPRLQGVQLALAMPDQSIETPNSKGDV